MAENSNIGESDRCLDEVFQRLQVDQSWRGTPSSCDILPEVPCSNVFRGKMNKRSPGKEKESEAKPHSKRMRPYETDDLPFGESLTKLSFDTEECKNVRCTCNKKHRTYSSGDVDLLNFVKACKTPQVSPERKLIKDSRFKLHHQVKDHKIVLRAARLKLHQINKNWYKGPVLRKGTALKQGVFGSDKTGKDFDSLAQSKQRWATETEAREMDNFSGFTFKQQRVSSRTSEDSSSRVFRCPDSDENHAEDGCCCTPFSNSSRHWVTRPCPLHPGICAKPCSCAEQARMDVQDYSVDELASYLDEFVYIPKKMSEMAEMMYT